MGTREITVPMVWIYAGAALLLLLIVGGYGIGYRLGIGSARASERREAVRDAEGVFVDDPLRQNGERETGSPQAGRTGAPGSGQRTREGTTSGSGSDLDSASGGSRSGLVGVLRADGRTTPDPRREGVNYLELVTLPREQAIEAVRYLSENGEEAIAVPASELDPRRRRSNTSDSFRVIALGLAVPGDRYSSSANARKQFEDRLRRLGKAWTDGGGVSDFSDPLWRRFGG